jgi:hypothetical protein
MPLGPIHLISEETETGAGAVYFCGIEDAIAAINPARMEGFPQDALCPDCLRIFQERTHGKSAPT